MSRAERIAWWLEQASAARRAVGAARIERGRTPQPGGAAEAARTPIAPITSKAAIPAPAYLSLRGETITGERDQERWRKLPDVSGRGGGIGGAPASRIGRSSVEGGLSGESAGALGQARRLAAGYQPAVVKVISYAHGVTRATATSQYVQRDEIPVETHDGRLLKDGHAVAAEIKDWSSTFEKRKESQDVVTVGLRLQGSHDTPEGRETLEKAIAAGFAGHRYAYRVEGAPSGEIEARIVVAMAGPPKERFRIREDHSRSDRKGSDRRLDARSQSAITARIEKATGLSGSSVSLTPGGAGHGRDGVAWQLSRQVERHGVLIDDHGRPIASAADVEAAAREWSRSLRSQSPRDTMHLMVSAKAGVNVEAFTNAVRNFLHDRFAEHKFLFGVHTDKAAEGHIHAHAVITVKNEIGQKIHPSRDDFRVWRETYAEHARAQGLKIVATSAMERASSQSYGPKDKAIVDVAERPRPQRERRDRTYAADNQSLIHNARQRIAAARANPIRLPATDAERRMVGEAVAAWSTVAHELPVNTTARQMLERLSLAQAVGGILHAIEKRVLQLTKEETGGMAISSEQMVRDLRAMNEAVSRTTDLLDGETKQQFREASARYLETLANRIDLQRVQEQGVDRISRAELEKMIGADADRLIARARNIEAREQREAMVAQDLANRAIDVERRQEAQPGLDPRSQRELRTERAVVAASRQSAASEGREAAAAAEAARSIAAHPAQPISPALVQTEALARLRAEQEQILREIEAERGETQAIKGQRMT